MIRHERPPHTLAEPCPLCDQPHAALLHRTRVRSFWRCGNCSLIFVPADERPDAAAEKARYDLHENDPFDSKYQQHLSPLCEAIIQSTRLDAEGLDFGCGPGPALAMMLRRAGRSVSLFDPFYAPDETVWARTYDFITASEVVEHLHRPRQELDRLFQALRAGGVLGLTTRFVPNSAEEFASWHYIRDPTHVCFFGRTVFNYIASTWDSRADFPSTNVILLTRTGP